MRPLTVKNRFALVAASVVISWCVTSPVNAQECTTVTLNRNCTIVIDRELPVSPLPVKVASDAQVIIQVGKRPTESIVFDVKLADSVPEDPLGAIFAAFSPHIASLLISAGAVPPAFTPPVVPPAPAGVPPTDAQRRQAVETTLDEILREQATVETQLGSVEAEIKTLGTRLRAFQATPAGGWSVAGFALFKSVFVCAATAPQGTYCDPGFPLGGVVKRPLPLGVLKALDVRIKEVTTDYANLPEAARLSLASKMNAVREGQVASAESVKSLRDAQQKLDETAATLNGVTPANVYDERTLGGFSAQTNRTATVKISAKDFINKEAVELGTVVVQWGGTKWEVSGGAMFSFLRGREFSNAPIIVDGVPQRDDNGVRTVITETDTRPVVVPSAFAHYRYAETTVGGQRLAFLITGGIGINTQSGSADFAFTLFTVSYRGLMVSPLYHRTRDLRLTNGLKTGMELGSSAPDLTTEWHWVNKFALGVSYRIPIK